MPVSAALVPLAEKYLATEAAKQAASDEGGGGGGKGKVSALAEKVGKSTLPGGKFMGAAQDALKEGIDDKFLESAKPKSLAEYRKEAAMLAGRG